MKSLINYFLKRSFVVNLITVFICIFGLISFFHSKRDLIPQIEVKLVQVRAILVGASPIDIERTVTFPIEEAIKNTTGIKLITSNSYNSGTSINVFFNDSFDSVPEASEEIKSLIDSIRGDLPDKLEPVEVVQVKVDSITAMNFAIHGVDKLSDQDRNWVLKLEEMLLEVNGIVSVSNGLQKREIFIEFNKNKIQEYNVSISDIRNKIYSAISYMPVASLDKGPNKIAIEIKNNLSKIDTIKSIPIISNRSGNTLYLKDLANVNYRFPKTKTKNLLRGEEYVAIEAKKDLNSDIITISDELVERVKEYNKKSPKHIKAEILADTSTFIEKQLEVLKSNAILGLILVCLTLYLLLGGRISLMTVLGLPFTYFGTFIILGFFGVSIDLISVVGLILVIGILVDDAIVVSEQYVQNLEKGMPSQEAAFNAARSTIIPVTGTVLTTAVAFASLLIVSSSASSIIFAIPCVVISSLSLSWFESFFILPNHLQHFVKSKSKRTDGLVFKSIRESYTKLLARCLRFRYLFFILIVIFLFFSFFVAASKLEKNFRLSIGSEYLSIDVALKSSPSLDYTREKLSPIITYLNSLSKNEIHHYYTKIGKVWRNNRELEGNRFANFSIQLSDSLKNPKEVKKRLEKEITKKLEKLKTDTFDYLYVKSVMKGDEKNINDIITVYVSGRDRMPFDKVENEISKVLKNVNGVKDIFVEDDKFIKTWQFYPNLKQLMKYRLSNRDLAVQLRDYFSPQELTQVRINGENTYIYTQYANIDNVNYADLAKLEVLSPLGESIPTSFLGHWKKNRVPKYIKHEDLFRKIEVDIRYDKEIMVKDKLADEIDKALLPLREKYPVFTFSVVKESRSEKESKDWAMKVGLLAAGLILLILMLCLQSIIQPLLVISVIPFGVIGVIWALYFHSLPLGIMALIGIIGMAGVVVNDSLIMVDAINRIDNNGPMFEKIIDGAKSRLRPILITTITTLGGVFPMAYGVGGEVGFTRPLVFAMGWGLVFATTLTLFFLPALLLIMSDLKSRFIKINQWGMTKVKTKFH